jgi:hypothetical protein
VEYLLSGGIWVGVLVMLLGLRSAKKSSKAFLVEARDYNRQIRYLRRGVVAAARLRRLPLP